ncbi:MAG: glycosyltransferase family 25 protein [Methyloglobulus sp.]|nr:glycosyltransferase family 25 protein [Methyloglobulus sp.]
MNELLDYFQRVYIINLPSRTDRKREIQAQLTKIGLGLDHPQIELFAAIRPDQAGDFPSIGARGCFLSHLGVLKDAQRHGLEKILILEDDLDFSSDFLLRISGILDGLVHSNWGVFYGGYKLFAPIDNMPDAELAVVPPGDVIQTAHFIGFQQPIIAMLVDYLERVLSRPGGDPEGGPMHVDGAYSWFRRQHPDVVTSIAIPELGHQRSSKTDIHELRWYDRWLGVKSLVAVLRQFKSR